MRRVLPFVFLATAALVVAAGCDLGDDLDPSRNLTFDAAVVAADGTLEDLRMMHGPGLGLPGIVFPPLEGDRPNCPMSEGTFSCPPIERDGLTYTREITYYDQGGGEQDAYVEGETASIHYLITVEGELGREWWTASIFRTRDLTVKGLPLTGVEDDGLVTWNGTGIGNIERSRHTDGGELRTYSMESDFQINAVVIPYPRTENGWPESGNIVRNMTITRTMGSGETETFTRTITITFEGEQLATVSVGGEEFVIDLNERAFGPGKMQRHRNRRGMP